MSVSSTVLDRLKDIVGPKGVIDDPADMEPYVTSWRDGLRGRTPLIVRPAATEDVARVLRICNDSRTPVVPQSGNTGLTGAGIPFDGNDEIVLSLNRMTNVRAVDTANDTLTVEAGCILADIQATAAEHGRLFPLSLGAEGSCRIGGNLSTNAGGVQVLRYGNARDLVLGLEVVLPNGEVWDGLRGLRKDNTGYDLKHLFMGAEGTLGVITAAVLKLFPRPKQKQTAFVAVPDVAAAVSLLSLARDECGDAVTCFELIQRIGLEFVLRHVPGTRDPFDDTYPWYVLIELWGQRPGDHLREDLERVLELAMDKGLIGNGVVAASDTQAAALWRLREELSAAQKPEGEGIKHDVSVPISNIAEFIERANAAVTDYMPDIRPLAFGHVGDGNLHYNPAPPVGADIAAFKTHTAAINRMVHDIVHDLNGSISAEHGLGRIRRDEIKRYKSAIELDLMRSLKRAVDPNNIMNPGKMLPD